MPHNEKTKMISLTKSDLAFLTTVTIIILATVVVDFSEAKEKIVKLQNTQEQTQRELDWRVEYMNSEYLKCHPGFQEGNPYDFTMTSDCIKEALDGKVFFYEYENGGFRSSSMYEIDGEFNSSSLNTSPETIYINFT